MLGGFVGSIPGVSDPGTRPTRMIEGTSDTTTLECSQLRATAETYAAKYNQMIVGSD
jgi:hypothetical protein